MSTNTFTSIITVLVIVSFLLLPVKTPANVVAEVHGSTIIVQHDLGGRLFDRLIMMDTYVRDGNHIIIRGTCASACTMYLAIGCVEPGATLGFHGPSVVGNDLSSKAFNEWSTVMANNYPPKIKDLFMEKWRYTTKGVYWITGKQAINLGAKAC